MRRWRGRSWTPRSSPASPSPAAFSLGEHHCAAVDQLVERGVVELRGNKATTAAIMLRDVARVEPGETVLVHDAAGGVGSMLGRMARVVGAGRVIGTVGSEGKIAYARAVGYHDVVLANDFEASVRALTGGGGVDVAVDQVGARHARRASRYSNHSAGGWWWGTPAAPTTCRSPPTRSGSPARV